jgi:hypothetical protein
MIVMLDTSRQSWDEAHLELDCPIEDLLTPLTRYHPKNPEGKFAIDNGAFSKFDAMAFLSLLEREAPRKHLCRFVAVPDVVGSARRTLEVFDHWFPLLNHWPLALVIQDGQEHLPIPWEYITTVFIGGTTKFKESDGAIQIIKAAKAVGKWCHVGRVNTPARFEAFEKLGVDSIDGTGLARYSHMRRNINERNSENRLFKQEEMVTI